jgi:hypothetical protein
MKQSPPKSRRRKSGRTRATSTASATPTSKSYTIEQIQDGWRCVMPHSAGSRIIVAADPRYRRGVIEATLSVYRDSSLLHRARINLTSPRARQTFLAAHPLCTLKKPKLQESLLLALEEACRTPDDTGADPSDEAPATPQVRPHPYERRDDGLYRWSGDHRVLLFNADARIIGEISKDDGHNVPQLYYEIEGNAAHTATASMVVPVREFPRLDWIPALLGGDAIPAAGRDAHDHLRAAIQYLSHHPIPRRTVFTHTGWLPRADRPLYLFHGGAIDRGGLVADMGAELSGSLTRIQLPAPPRGAELRGAVRASLALRDLGPTAIMLPLLACVYLAPLCPLLPIPPDFLMWLLGTSGTFKSELIALLMQHYGNFSRLTLPASFEATANAIERLLFDAKDTLLPVDDYHPVPDRVRAQQMAQVADRLIRAVGNRQGRQRMAADTSSRPDLPPRALPISSGEHLPEGYSTSARVVVLRVAKGAITAEKLTTAQAQAGLFSAAMSGYLQYVARQWNKYVTELPVRFSTLRAEFAAAKEHHREAGQLAHLQLALEILAEFAVHVDALTAAEAESLLHASGKTLSNLSAEHGNGLAEQRLSAKFCRVVLDGFAARRFYLEDPGGGPPSGIDPRRCGWEPGDPVSGRTQYSHPPGALLLGWHRKDKIALIPQVTVEAIRRAAPGQFDVDERSLCRELAEQNVIEVKHDPDGVRYRIQMRDVPTSRVFSTSLAALEAAAERDAVPGNPVNPEKVGEGRSLRVVTRRGRL